MIEEFVEQAVSWNCALGDGGRTEKLSQAKAMLAAEPALASDPLAAMISGNAELFGAALAGGEISATGICGPRSWQPLLYCCFSRFWADEEASLGLPINASILLAAGADPNASFELEGERESCLYGAVGVVGDPSLTALLVKHGAEVNEGEVAYHVAEFPGSACAKVLFENGLSPGNQATVLLRKLDFDDLEGTREILEMGADPDGMGIWGKTPLHQAIMRGRSLETIKLILGYGADPGIARKDGTKTMDLARKTGNEELISMLEKASR